MCAARYVGSAAEQTVTESPPSRGLTVFAPVVGNHCLYVGREELERRLGLENAPFYVRDVSSAWRIIVVDTMHVSTDRPEGDSRRDEADKYLREHAGDENAVTWNGGLGYRQMQVRPFRCGAPPWLRTAS
jgi:hypothetical protein